MQVTIVEAGGLAGGERTVGVVDSDRLDTATGARLAELVARLEARGEIGADLPGYRIEVADAAGARSFTVVAAADPATTGLLEELTALATSS